MRAARFLFFLYYFPPLPGTAPKRNHQIAKEISKRVSFSQIFTSATQEDQQVNSEKFSIQTIPTYDYRYFLKKRTKEGAFPEVKKKSRFKQTLVKLINTYPFNIIIGEGGLVYYWALLKNGRNVIREQKITHLYSSFRPFTDHYAAYILKKKNPELFWIADFRDLIIDPHYNHILFAGTHQWFFKRIFKRADLLTTVSDGLAKHLHMYNENVITLRNGIPHVPDHIEEVRCKYFKIAYTGSMFLDKRNAEPLFIALNMLINQNLVKDDDVRIVYAGKDSEYWNALSTKYDMDTIIVDKGVVSAEESLSIQQKACINLLLTIASDELEGVLTGKMIEYFEAGSPVLAIAVNKDDPELSSMLSELQIGASFSDREKDYEGIKNFIYEEYHHWKNSGMNRKPVRLDVLKKKYSVEETMRPLYEKLKSV